MNGFFLDLLKGSVTKVLQGELTFWGVALQWVCTARRSEANLKLEHRWVMKLGELSAPCTDAVIYIHPGRADLKKSTIRSAMDLTDPCSFPKRFSQIFSRGIFSIEKPSATRISWRRKRLIVLQFGISLHKSHAYFSR